MKANLPMIALLGLSSFSLAACDIHTSTYLYDEHPRRPAVVREAPSSGYYYGNPVVAPQPVIVHRAPPAPRPERIVASPGPGYVWVPGYWAASRGEWVWVGGHWERPPRRGAVWVPPRYEREGRDSIRFEVGIWK
jgi:hypothetical protein